VVAIEDVKHFGEWVQSRAEKDVFFVFKKIIKLFLLDAFFRYCRYKVMLGEEC
jgi:hypothetical protein